jgi:MFS family permease
MKLNKKRTLLIAFAFFAILMLWQVYYYYVPLFLNHMLLEKFGGENGDYDNIIGHIMSLDNLAAILVIPLFGWLSDRTHTRLGRRMPYIIAGMAVSLVIFPLVAAMFLLNQFVWYFVMVVALVFSMAAFRSPAVSLMPDITPKPLRVGANSIINFVGYLGAILGGGMTILFAYKSANPTNAITIVPFFITAVLMCAVIVVFLLKFNEPAVVNEMKNDLAQGEKQSEAFTNVEGVTPSTPPAKLSPKDKFNFAVIITAVFFCWFAFNALQNFGSLYAERILNAEDKWGMCTIALAVASLCAFLPSMWLSRAVGRKWSVIIGMGVVIFGLVVAAIFVHSFGILIILLFALMGIGWAVVMVNSYPMFVELANTKNVGRFTGIYYFVSQGAMFLTSNISGYVFKFVGLRFFYSYAIVFMTLAFVVCFLYKNKRNKCNTKCQCAEN